MLLRGLDEVSQLLYEVGQLLYEVGQGVWQAGHKSRPPVESIKTF